ncbi:MAG: hypothetical protein U0350_13760 [Caldilineaceae bacterium]
MVDEKKSGPAQEGGRRRYFWRKKRGQKPGGTEPAPKEQPAQSKQRSAPKANNQEKEKAERDQRTRRRRRRPRSRQNGAALEPKVIAPPTPIEDDYVPPKSIFIYTHVVRPDQRDSYEFRAEHFGKSGRRLEDFDIDLSILFPEDNPQAAESDANHRGGIVDNQALLLPETLDDED